MASKKKTVSFNKKNTLAFADKIFTDKGGIVSMLKLCDGTLRDSKKGQQPMHCALGEAYYHFVSKSSSSMKKLIDTDDDYASKYVWTPSGATAKALDVLVETAQLKSPTAKNQKKLAKALDNAMAANDNQSGNEIGEFAERAKNVAEVFRKQVAPLLK